MQRQGFLSTPSARRATAGGSCVAVRREFLSTPSARRATRSRTEADKPFSNFYPRPPRGGRRPGPALRSISAPISIHALREEGDSVRPVKPVRWHRFLSTPSARRATSMGLGSTSALGDFYPRPPRGGRLTKSCRRVARPRFLSTPSAMRATDTVRAMHRMQNPISIHALREEGDITPISAFARASHFYPRPPRGGRPEKSIVRVARIIFLSTPSARRATCATSSWS